MINALKFTTNRKTRISMVCYEYSSLEYSYDGVDWSEWDLSDLTINSGDILYIRGYNPNGFNINGITFKKYCHFEMTGGKVSCSGNIMSLIDYKNLPNAIPCSQCFYGLFKDCDSLTAAPELPATRLTYNCYEYMFSGCSSLTTTPELPAKVLADSCYDSMFKDCSSLTTAPELPAIELASNCYESMFKDCTSLTTAPELPAAKLANFCYKNMFSGCTSLKIAPELPAAKLANFCYDSMFSGCTSLKNKPELTESYKSRMTFKEYCQRNVL